FEFAPTASYSGPIILSTGTLRFGGDSGRSVLVPSVSGGAITAADGTTIAIQNVQDFQRAIDISQGASVGSVALSFGTSNVSTKISGPISIASNKTLAIGPSASGLLRFSGAMSGAGG